MGWDKKIRHGRRFSVSSATMGERAETLRFCCTLRLTGGTSVKYMCLGYIQPGKFETMAEMSATPCWTSALDYDDQLRSNGHFAAGELFSPGRAMTLYWKNGKVAVTDGPYAESKEH